MEKTLTKLRFSLSISGRQMAVTLLIAGLSLYAGLTLADHRYDRDGTGYRHHGGDAYGSYKYPRGQSGRSVVPGAGLNYGHRPGDGLNSNRYRDNRRSYPSYRSDRGQNRHYGNRRFSSNRPPQTQNGTIPPKHGHSRHGAHDRKRRTDSVYDDGYSRGFERGYSRGRRDSRIGRDDRYGHRDRRFSRQNPYYRDRRSNGGGVHGGYSSPYRRY